MDILPIILPLIIKNEPFHYWDLTYPLPIETYPPTRSLDVNSEKLLLLYSQLKKLSRWKKIIMNNNILD